MNDEWILKHSTILSAVKHFLSLPCVPEETANPLKPETMSWTTPALPRALVLQVWFLDQQHHITWKLVRNAKFGAPLDSGVSISDLCFGKPSMGFWSVQEFENKGTGAFNLFLGTHQVLCICTELDCHQKYRIKCLTHSVLVSSWLLHVSVKMVDKDYMQTMWKPWLIL